MKIKATAPFDITERKEATATGDPSYTSAVHKWNGTTDNLNANAVKRKTNANICKGELSRNAGNSEKLIVPVAPYNKEMPNNKMPDENADERIIFMAPSEDCFFSRSKFTMAATGIVASSSDK
jgi:hypothetical protein